MHAAVSGPHRLSNSEALAAQSKADEDRWGLYHGVKAMAKTDPEAQGQSDHPFCTFSFYPFLSFN